MLNKFVGTRKELNECPIRVFARHMGKTREDIIDMVHFPLRYSEEELEDMREKADEVGYYPNPFAKLMSYKTDFPGILVSGDYEYYLPILLKLNLPTMITLLPEHFIHRSFTSRWVVICGRGPINLTKCITMPITIFDGPDQNIFPSINTPDPEYTAEIFCKNIRDEIMEFYKIKVSL